VNGGRNHSADNRRGEGVPHLRADSAFPKDRHKAGKHYEECQPLRAKLLHCCFNGCLFDLLVRDAVAAGEALIKCCIEVHDPGDARLDGDSEQRNVADANGPR